MSQTLEDPQQTFHSRLAETFRSLSKEDLYQKVRAKCWDQFTELGLPSRHLEVYQYIKLRKLYSQTFQSAKNKQVGKERIGPFVLPECQGFVLVFVNGHYCAELSAIPERSKIVCLPLSQAVRSYGAFLNNRLNKASKEETDPFAALNGAFCEEGVFIYAPPKTVLDRPIQILHLIDCEGQQALMTPRLHLFAGVHSQISLIASAEVLSGESFFFNGYIDAAIEEGAHVSVHSAALGISEQSWMFDAFRATLKRDSSLKTYAVTDGAATVRGDYRVQLLGENAHASLNGLWMLQGRKEAHTNVLIDHFAPHCTSKQLFKGVLDGASSSSFEGKIYVRQEAQKTDAFQLNNNLLLSDQANADSKPNLEIFADDVKASHGATIGQIDKEQLFYLETRGYSDTQAKQLLVKGFCKEVLDLFPLSLLKNT